MIAALKSLWKAARSKPGASALILGKSTKLDAGGMTRAGARWATPQRSAARAEYALVLSCAGRGLRGWYGATTSEQLNDRNSTSVIADQS